MNPSSFYDNTCFACSKLITKKYSTSFSKGISAFSKQLRNPIYGIYGFVRYADEIVDTFHQNDKQKLLHNFKHDTHAAINDEFSSNPVLHAFQLIVNRHGIERALIDQFFSSMEMDIDHQMFTRETYNHYIHGSAEVIGLMCLKVFCGGDETLYQKLEPAACKLGAAFQKVNFLRDLASDHNDRGRTYFPGIEFENFGDSEKSVIEQEIEADFHDALSGIKQLPGTCRLGVYVAYVYYRKLLQNISETSVSQLKQSRIRVSAGQKLGLYLKASLVYQFKAI